MAEFRDRPDVQTVDVLIETGSSEIERRGANLDDVLRVILFDMKKNNQWGSTAEMAHRLGLKQQTLATFMDEKRTGTTIATLSTICAATQQSPIEIFHRHERYPPKEGDRPGFADDLIFNRFRAILDRGEASRLLRLVELAKDVGALDEILTTAEKVLPTSLSGRNKRPQARENP